MRSVQVLTFETLKAVTLTRRFWLKTAAISGIVLLVLGGLLLWLFWDSAYELSINPRQPFLTVEPPKAPDYAEPAAWAALPGRMDSADLVPHTMAPGPAAPPQADVFFIHPTTKADDNGWNLSYRHEPAKRVDRIALPNLAAAFAHNTRLFAPRYRQATQYAFRNRNEDSRLAYRFAYDDLRRAFRHYLSEWNAGRPFFLVGTGQGGLHAAGLLQEMILETDVAGRLIAVYIIGTAVPQDLFEEGALRGVQPCRTPESTGCVAAWSAFPWGASAKKLNDRAMIWENGELVALEGRQPVCVNPLSWRMDGVPVMRENNGGSLPVGRRWGVRLPALVAHAAGAHCVDGILRVDRPTDGRLRRDLLPGRPHNLLDAALFFDSIQTNLRTRQRAFLKNGGARAASRAGHEKE